MILSKPAGTVYVHNLMWHRFQKFTNLKKKNHKQTQNNNKVPVCFEVISYLFHSVPPGSVDLEFDKQDLHLRYPLLL